MAALVNPLRRGSLLPLRTAKASVVAYTKSNSSVRTQNRSSVCGNGFCDAPLQPVLGGGNASELQQHFELLCEQRQPLLSLRTRW